VKYKEFEGYLWDPFRGFEWPIEYELPMRIPYVDVIDSGNEYVVKAELPRLKKENVQIEVGKETEEKVRAQLILHTYRRFVNKVNFMPRKYYERAEDWMVTCSVCHGSGATGEGDSRKRCPKCDGAGRLSSTPQTRKALRNST
jgi:hypothetical protein